MTATEFSAWIEARGLSDQAAADLLAARRNEVNRWRKGKRTVPGRVARIVELMETVSNLTAKEAQARMTGKEIVTSLRSTIGDIACEYPRDPCETSDGWMMCDNCASRRQLLVLARRLEAMLKNAEVWT